MCEKGQANKMEVDHHLAKFREEWEEAACGQDFDDGKWSVDLLLIDVEEATGFEPGEIRKVISQEIVQ